MRQVKIFKWLASAVVCSLLLTAGCAPADKEITKINVEPEKQIPKAPKGETVTIALKFSPQDSSTYRVIMETERGIKWEGPVPEEPTFKDGRNFNKLDMTFTQETQSVDDTGKAMVKITVKELKYSSIVKDSPPLEFDSTIPENHDPNYPLAKLIGQSYTIQIAPTGEFTGVADIRAAESEVRKGSEIPRTALRLLGEKAMQERHGTLILADANQNQLSTGDSWSKTKTFSFGMMGSESYEQIYTLDKIKKQDDHQLAIIKMSAIPASEVSKQQAQTDIIKSSDNTKTYSGELELDLSTGKVNKYIEKMQSDWVIAFPSSEQNTQEPAILTMSDNRIYSLEKID